MSRMIYTSGSTDLPSEAHLIAASCVQAMFKGGTPVATLRVARSMCKSEGQVRVYLRHAERAGLVMRDGEDLWVPMVPDAATNQSGPENLSRSLSATSTNR